jgi:site-specific DNA-methyltransferase (adenine-specific)/modification methylase
MTNPVIIGNAILYHGDALEVLPTLPMVDALVTDPPYGIGESAGKAITRTSGLSSALRGANAYRKDYGDDDWDDEPISDALMTMARNGAQWSVIFGGNYYAFPATTCWLVWDKLNGDTDFADCELAWTNLPKAVRRIQFLWNGCMRARGEKRGDHPTQKPVGVMEWAINHVPRAETVLDPFMGSGTTGVAAMNLSRKFIGIERQQKYFDIACRRIDQAQCQSRLFA